jgi:chromosome segregation ATPase
VYISQRQRIQKRSVELESELAAFRSFHIEELRKLRELYEAQLGATRSEIAQLRQEFGGVQMQLSVAIQERDEALRRLQGVGGDQDRLRQEIVVLRRELEIARGELAKLQDIAARGNSQTSELQARLAAALQERDAFAAGAERANGERDAALAENRQLRGQLETRNRELDELRRARAADQQAITVRRRLTRSYCTHPPRVPHIVGAPAASGGHLAGPRTV